MMAAVAPAGKVQACRVRVELEDGTVIESEGFYRERRNHKAGPGGYVNGREYIEHEAWWVEDLPGEGGGAS